MSLTLSIFYVLSLLALLSAAGILFTKNLLHAAFLLMITLISVAGIFVLSGADFLAVAQIMVYIGGILVLILFGVMMTKNESTQERKSFAGTAPFIALVTAFGLFYVVYVYLTESHYTALPWISKALEEKTFVIHSTIQPLGILLMTKYLLPFEFAGLVLLVALIGAAFVAGKIKMK